MLSAVSSQLLSQARSSSTTRTAAAALSLTVRRAFTGGGQDRLSTRELVRLQQQILAIPTSTRDILRHPLCPTPMGWFDTHTLDEQLEQLQQEALHQQRGERQGAAATTTPSTTEDAVQQQHLGKTTTVIQDDPAASIFSMDGTEDEAKQDASPIECMNRNARYGKRANRGKRPCSRQRRRAIKRAFGNWRR